MRKSARPGVRADRVSGSKSGADRYSDAMIAVYTKALRPAAASQISCEPRGSVRTSASRRGVRGFVTS